MKSIKTLNHLDWVIILWMLTYTPTLYHNITIVISKTPSGIGYSSAGRSGPIGPDGLSGIYFEEKSDMELSVDDVMACIQGIKQIVAKADDGSYIESEKISTYSNKMTIKIPANKVPQFTASIIAIEGVTLDTITYERQDMTNDVIDTISRIKTMENTSVRLQELSSKTTDPMIILQIHDKLMSISEVLDRAEAKRKNQHLKTTFATLSISISKKPINHKQETWAQRKFELLLHSFITWMDNLVDFLIRNVIWIPVIVGAAYWIKNTICTSQ